jgi:hypothetical protein
MKIVSTNWRSVIVVATLLAACALVWLQFICNNGGGGQDSSTSPSLRARDSWQERFVRRGIAQLRAGKTGELAPLTASHGTAEAMPEVMRRRIGQNLNGVGSLHLRFDQAQYEPTPVGVGVWIVEGRGVACIFTDGMPASSCRTSVDARREGIWLGTYRTSKVHPGRPTSFLTLGAVPDNVRAVSLIVGSDPPTTIRVLNHVWAVRTRASVEIQRLIR